MRLPAVTSVLAEYPDLSPKVLSVSVRNKLQGLAREYVLCVYVCICVLYCISINESLLETKPLERESRRGMKG